MRKGFNVTAIIYKIIYPNGMIYVGGTTQSFEARKKQHIRTIENGSHSNENMTKLAEEYFISDVRFEIIEECTKEEKRQREDYWINFYLDKLGGEKICNFRYSGGAKYLPSVVNPLLGKPLSDVHKKAIKDNAARGENNAAKRPEVRKKISESKIGDKNHNFGKPQSIEAREKNRQAHLGKSHNEEWNRHVSEALKGKPSKVKGKTYEEIYGKEKAEELKKLRSITKKKQYEDEIERKKQSERLKEHHKKRLLY